MKILIDLELKASEEVIIKYFQNKLERELFQEPIKDLLDDISNLQSLGYGIVMILDEYSPDTHHLFRCETDTNGILLKEKMGINLGYIQITPGNPNINSNIIKIGINEFNDPGINIFEDELIIENTIRELIMDYGGVSHEKQSINKYKHAILDPNYKPDFEPENSIDRLLLNPKIQDALRTYVTRYETDYIGTESFLFEMEKKHGIVFSGMSLKTWTRIKLQANQRGMITKNKNGRY